MTTHAPPHPAPGRPAAGTRHPSAARHVAGPGGRSSSSRRAAFAVQERPGRRDDLREPVGQPLEGPADGFVAEQRAELRFSGSRVDGSVADGRSGALRPFFGCAAGT